MKIKKITSYDSGDNTLSVETDGETFVVPRADMVGTTDFLSECIVEREMEPVNTIKATISGTDDVSVVYRADRQQMTYYISPSGSDSNGGLSRDDAWLTWDQAEGVLEAGDVLILMDGTHSSLFVSGHYITFNGSENKPITIKADNNATPYINYYTIYGDWGVIDGVSAGFAFSYGEYITIKNCSFSTTSTTYNAFTIHENHGWIKFIDCEFSDQPNRTLLDNVGSQSILIRGCYFHDGYRAVHAKGGATDVIVENCYIENMDEAAFVGTSVTLVTCYNPHGSDYIHDTGTAVADRYQANNLLIRNNVVVGCAAWAAVRISGWRNYKILNNTFVDLTGSYAIVVDDSGCEFVDATALSYTPRYTCVSPCTDPAQCCRIQLYSKSGEIKNNIFQNISGPLLRVWTDNTIPDMDYNLVDDAQWTDVNNPSDAYVIFGTNRTLAQVRSSYSIEDNTVLDSVSLDSGDYYSGGPSGGVTDDDVTHDYDWVRRASAELGAH